MMPGSCASMSTSGRRVSRYVVEARWASWVHSSRGRVRASRPSPICSISASEWKVRGRYSVIGSGPVERPDPRTGLSGCGLRLRLLLRLLRDLGRRLSDALVHMLRELREILDEQVDELGRGAVVLVLVGPRVARVENGRIYARNVARDVESEIRILAERHVLQAAVERRFEQRAGCLDRHAFADAVFAAGP